MTKKQWANYLKPWVKGYGDDNRINALALADRILAAEAKARAYLESLDDKGGR